MIFTMEISAVLSNDTKIQLIPLPEDSRGMRLRYCVNCHCFIPSLQLGIKMGARQTWIPISFRGLKTEVFPSTFLLTVIVKAEDSIWGATVTPGGCEGKHTSYKTQLITSWEKGKFCWHTDILNSMSIKLCAQLETHQNMIPSQANHWCVTKPGWLAAFNDLLHLLKFLAVFKPNYGRRIWNIDIVFQVPNSILLFMLSINPRKKSFPMWPSCSAKINSWLCYKVNQVGSVRSRSFQSYLTKDLSENVLEGSKCKLITHMRDRDGRRNRDSLTTESQEHSPDLLGWGEANRLPRKTHTL